MALEEFVQGFWPSMVGKLESHQNVELRWKGKGKGEWENYSSRKIAISSPWDTCSGQDLSMRKVICSVEIWEQE